MAVDLDKPIEKGIAWLKLKIIEYDVSLQPAYFSMGYPVPYYGYFLLTLYGIVDFS